MSVRVWRVPKRRSTASKNAAVISDLGDHPPVFIELAGQ
jgi:hypothetical protein